VRHSYARPQTRCPIGLGERAELWRTDVGRLLAERARLAGGSTVEAPPVGVAARRAGTRSRRTRSIRRPLPRQLAPWARRGTAFHTWPEERWQAQTLLDLDQLPGAADETADDGDFEALRVAFLAGEWANRTPTEVEVPFEMAVQDDRVVRGRMDAVFGNAVDSWVVVDWKTGASLPAPKRKPPPSSWRHTGWRARLCGILTTTCTACAAFHYVRTNETVEPACLTPSGCVNSSPVRATDLSVRAGAVRQPG
jgi:DNA helicase-2/ATP-dependent DNA helicase PcrA